MDDSNGSALLRWGALVLVVVAGLLASAFLLVDYLSPAPVFCDIESGCEAVKQSIWSHPGGVPMPVFGVLGFLALGVLSVLRGGIPRILLVAGSVAASAVGLFLIVVQQAIGHFCPFCLVADSAAVMVLALSLWRVGKKWDPPKARSATIAAAALFALAVIGPVATSRFLKPKIPAVIARELEKTPPGKITVIDFADFECPFCREAHAELEPILASYQDKVRVVRKQVPLTHLHPHAMDAARAACCGETLGKGEPFANRLFSAEDLTPEGCEKIAAELGLDLEVFRACVKNPETDKRIRDDIATFRASHGKGLPTLWNDSKKLEGAQKRSTLEQAVKSAVMRVAS
jgi:predicted DsbA family dithiol-disulfide isomerase/uncharacterized membrane protein